MDNPLVSIIIPCYNGEAYIYESIKSAIEQTYRNKEVIVIDDGSTDGSLSIIKAFGDNVRWETGHNRGGPAARNKGLAISRGEYIQFLDADDFLYPEKLQEQVVTSLKSDDHLIYCDWRLIHPGPELRTKICTAIPRTEDPVALALDRQNISISAPLHKREALLSVRAFREDLPCCQEWELHLRLAVNGFKFRHFPKVLYDVRQRKGSICSNELRIQQWRYTILNEYYELLRNREELSDERMRAFATAMAVSGRRLIQIGQVKIARSYFAAANKFHPSGGLSGAYSRPGKKLVQLVGPVMAEATLMRMKRTIGLFRE